MKATNDLVEQQIDEMSSLKNKKYRKFKKLKPEIKVINDLNVINADINADSDSDSDTTDDESDSIDDNTTKCVANEPKPMSSDLVIDNNKIKENNEKKECPQKPTQSVKAVILKREFVAINRTEEIEKFRSSLPITSEEHTIMESIFNDSVVIICGETGSGKTTQVPQFLFEAGFAQNGQMIGVTEPRRVAAIAMSQRVGHEMNVSTERVSFQIRFESNVTPNTRIKFMTDGVLLKEIQNDFLLTKYSVIIIDEAHERSLHSDILIGLLSRIVPLRMKKQNPLKLIIMSATLRVEDFTSNKKLLKTVPPVLEIDSRQYPVSIHFNRKTNGDYLHEAFKKVCKIHSECPTGGILVFVTGRIEVEVLCRKLRAKYPNNGSKVCEQKKVKTKRKENKNKTIVTEKIPAINLDDFEVNPLESENILDDLDYSDGENDDENIDAEDDQLSDDNTFEGQSQALHCLPLYAMLPHSQQVSIFKEPPLGSRLCVVATNVAETSLTIPNIKYVVDSGKVCHIFDCFQLLLINWFITHPKVKKKVYDNITGISTFIVDWTSKASADQRAGRAGRTGPGHCYRLYSSAIFNDEFPKYSEPEIIRKPIDDLMLQMKAMNIENVVNFPFPTQPSLEALMASEKRLISMGALKEVTNKLDKYRKNKKQLKTEITGLGKAMSHFPINPRYAKMLALSRQHQLMPYTIAIVSALTIQEIFISSDKNALNRRIRSSSVNGLLLGDVMVLLNAIGAAQFAGTTIFGNQTFCRQNGLRHKSIVEINKLRKQLSSQICEICKDLTLSLELNPPNDLQIKLLRQIMLSGFFDRVARKMPVLDIDLNDKEKKKLKNAYQSIEVEKPVFISTHSILADDFPEYVVYQEIFETSKLNMRNVVAIEPEWLPLFVPLSCQLSNPLESPSPRYDSTTDSVKCYRSSTFGPYDWPIRSTELTFPEGLERYKYFAKFLLEGEVISFFKTYSKSLLSPPSIITKSWASLQPRTENFLKSLVSQNIENRTNLINKWKSDSKCESIIT